MSYIFFYGLFMDAELLEGMGFHPELVGTAKLLDFQIDIGDKANLIPSRGSSCYGVVMNLPDGEAAALYSIPEVRNYKPEMVNPVLLHNATIQPSSCYILAGENIGAGVNREYAERLFALALKLGFPVAYAHEIVDR
jgi:hypothetical protein